MIIGVTEGYTKGLEIVGTGYRVARQGHGPRVRARATRTRSRSSRPTGISFTVEARPVIGRAVSTSRRSARSPRTSARSASQSPTRARASGTRVKLSAARPESQVSNHGSRNKRQGRSRRKARRRRHALRPQEGRRHRGAPAPGRHPVGPSHLRADHRRPKGHTLASASTLEADLRAFEGDKTAKAHKVGELVAERAKEAGVDARSSSTAVAASTRGASPRLPKPHEKADWSSERRDDQPMRSRVQQRRGVRDAEPSPSGGGDGVRRAARPP